MLSRFILLLSLFGSLAYATEQSSKELLSDAIKNSAKIKQNITTKQKLDVYSKIFSDLNEIAEKHSDSDEAIKILSNQDIGDFSPKSLRSDYIKLLSSYYDTVCEASPSFQCLGFVSLNNGIKQCENVKYYHHILSAQKSLLNAVNVFVGQKDNSGYSELAINAYQSCLSSVNLQTWYKDHFNSMLIEPLLAKGKGSVAKSIIENMETPYFKFNSVLEIEKSKGKKTGEAKILRLEKYIADKIEEDSWDAFLASVQLRIFSAKFGDNVIDYTFAYNAVQNNRPNFTTPLSTCNKPFVTYLYDIITDYELALFTIDKSRLKNIKDNQMQILFFQFSDHAKPGLDSCMDKGFNDYTLMSEVYGALMAKKSVAVAEQFKKVTHERDLSTEEIYDYYADQLIQSEDDIAKALDKGNGTIKNIFYNKEANYALFKKYVDFGNVCESSRILFQNLKGTKQYNQAINYMVSSESIDASKKYECGDEDLELLLN